MLERKYSLIFTLQERKVLAFNLAICIVKIKLIYFVHVKDLCMNMSWYRGQGVYLCTNMLADAAKILSKGKIVMWVRVRM